MEKIKSVYRRKPKLIAGLVILMALSLPFVINQVLKEQDIRQGAQTLTPVTITYNPLTQTFAVGQKFDVQLIIDTKAYDISAIEGYLRYDSSKITLSKLDATNSPYTVIQGERIGDDNSMIAQQIIAYNISADAITGPNKVFATVTFIAKAPGTIQISFGSPTYGGLNIAASGVNGSITVAPSELPTYTITGDCTTLATGRPNACYCDNNSQCESNDCHSAANGPTPLPGGSVSNYICWPTTSDNNNFTSFNYNGGRDHCRPTGKSCESALNESEVPNSSCSSYLGVNARACRTSGYPPITNSLLSECSTLSPDGYVRYCIPHGGEIPTGWTAVTNGDSACTDYNGVASKCYKSTFLASGNNNMSPTPTAKLSPNPTAKLSPTPTSVPAPTSTLAPTAAPIPGDTTVTLKAILPGVGSGASNLGLNPTPLNPQRSASIQVVKADNTVAKTVDGILTYASNSSSYTGNFSLGTSFPSGSYTVKLKFNNTLYKAVPGVLQITTGQSATVNSLTAVLVSGDLNGDNTLGVIDWTFMIACVKSEASCTDNIRKLADLNDNGSVDETDVQILQRGFALRDGD